MPETVHLTLPHRAESVPAARAAVVDVTRPWLEPAQAPSLALMVSEVMTNAVLHGGGGNDIELEVQRTNDTIRVEVFDRGEGFVPKPAALENDRGGGYGLYLVEQLADRWGWSRDTSTLVWFEVSAAPQRGVVLT